MVGRGVGVDDVEDTLAGDDEAVAEALAFGGVLARFEFGVLAFVVAGEVADDVRVLGFGEDERGGVVGVEFLRMEGEM